MPTPVKTSFFFAHMCCFDVTVEVNALGEKPGHDTYAEVTFRDQGGTCMAVGVNGSDPKTIDSFTLRFEGGAEVRGLIEAFEFLADELKRKPQPSVIRAHEQEEREWRLQQQARAVGLYRTGLSGGDDVSP